MNSARTKAVLGAVMRQNQLWLGSGFRATGGQAIEADGHDGGGDKVFHVTCSIDSGVLAQRSMRAGPAHARSSADN